jgi:probable rRNA maturation factor
MPPGSSRRTSDSTGGRSGRVAVDQSEPFLYLDRQRKHRVDRDRILGFLCRLTSELKTSSPFAVVLVSDRAMERYNRTYRGVGGATDVLSFPGGDGCLGDILISVETAYNQAVRFPVLNLDRNIERLTLHGLLHLMGYDHENDSGEMRDLELRLRRKLRC